MVAVRVLDPVPPAVPAVRPDRRALLLWGGVLALLMAWQLFAARDAWRTANGWEPSDIGRSLAEGHGYSFPPGRRWNFQGDPGNAVYGPTAWHEPLQPLLIAAAFRAAGPEYGRLLVILAQSLFLLLTAALLYLLGRRLFGPATGMLAGVLLLLQPHAIALAVGSLLAAPLLGLMVTTAVGTMLWCVEEPSPRRGAVLGVALAAAWLTSGCTMLFLPIAGTTLLWRRVGRATGARTFVMAAGVLVAVCAPWWARNYAVFHRFIPARSGFGQIAQVGNPILASTFVDGLAPCAGRQAPWRAGGPLEAVVEARLDHARRPLEQLGRDCMRDAGGSEYESLNEVQRDAIAQRQFTGFALGHPFVLLRLGAAKVVAFFWSWPETVQLLLVLSLAGAALTLGRRECRLMLACVLLFALPYVVTMPYFLRYRYPIEPLLLLFAAYPVVLVASRCLTLATRREGGSRPA